MPALQVKDFPADLYEELRACAVVQDRNISQQTVHIVREYLRAYRQAGSSASWVVRPAIDRPDAQLCAKSCVDETPEERIERRRKVFEAIDAMPKFEVPDDFPEPAELIRQMREERDDQIVPELSHIR
ncbi:MAG: argininosuccinate lyase [Gordonibacter sp.]|nr:argininosuccinate lyase [Gordonibacter sp.]